MTMSRRGETKQQGRDERVRYELAVSPAPVEVLAVTVFDESAGEDVSGAVATGLVAIEGGTVIVTPQISGLTPGHVYRVEVRYRDAGGNVLEPYFLIEGER
jgi:hypothetical protein